MVGTPLILLNGTSHNTVVLFAWAVKSGLMNYQFLGVSLLASGLVLLAPAHGALVITNQGGSTPTSSLISATTQDPTGSTTFRYNNDSGGANSNRDFGQTFSVTSGFTIDFLTLRVGPVNAIASNSSPSTSVTLNFYEVSGSTLGTQVLSVSAALPTNFANDDYIRLDLTGASEINFSASQTYAWTLRFDNFNANNALQLANAATGGYSGGQAIRDEWTSTSGTITNRGDWSFSSDVNRDFVFYINAIPEPSTYALLAMGAASLFALRRFRTRV